MSSKCHSFVAQWDDDGVYFYQAYNHAIADWAITNQRLGGPSFNPDRMTWMKPSFAWMLYRSGYATKSNQERILKIKLSHQSSICIAAIVIVWLFNRARRRRFRWAHPVGSRSFSHGV